jgi:RHS repeat-associated protein
MKQLVVNHYYAFGMMEEGMSQQGGEYRYGFNGKEAEKEWKGAGNALDYGARIYDPRLGRWMSVDRMSMKYPFASPYGFALNSPVLMSDVGGDSVWIETSTRLNSSGVLETVKTIHIVGKVLNISDDPMDVKKFAADVQSELEAKIIGIDPSDGSIIETSADIQVATSMSQVSSTDHLISIVDEVAGGARLVL